MYTNYGVNRLRLPNLAKIPVSLNVSVNKIKVFFQARTSEQRAYFKLIFQVRHNWTFIAGKTETHILLEVTEE